MHFFYSESIHFLTYTFNEPKDTYCFNVYMTTKGECDTKSPYKIQFVWSDTDKFRSEPCSDGGDMLNNAHQ